MKALIDYMSFLISNVVDYSMEQNICKLHYESFYVNDVIEDTLYMFNFLIENKKVKLNA